ncbi:hypothetical protein [Actinoplanes sp. NPDC051494]|uniref:hypothetical protein n=1 Tax=Actinoplanes sp. NPDC051494 TaxID=3363907 RepID=UPI00379FFD69
MPLEDDVMPQPVPLGNPEEQTALVYFTLGQKDWVGAIPALTWLTQLELPESMLHSLRTEIESILGQPTPSYSYHEVRSRTSWGADSGEIVHAVLFVASAAVTGVIGNAMYDLLKRFASSARGSQRLPMTEQEVVARASWVLVSHFAVDVESLNQVPSQEEDLHLVSVSDNRLAGSWTVTFCDGNGSTYVVDLGVDDLPMVNRIGWSVTDAKSAGNG